MASVLAAGSISDDSPIRDTERIGTLRLLDARNQLLGLIVVAAHAE